MDGSPPLPFSITSHASPTSSPTKSSGAFRATTHSAPSKLMDGQLTLLRTTMRERRGSSRQCGLSPLPPSPPRSPSALNRGLSCPPQPINTRSASPGTVTGEASKGEDLRSPVPKRRLDVSKAASASPRSVVVFGNITLNGTGALPRELPKFALLAGSKVPAPVLHRVAAWLPAQSLPSLRRASAVFYRATQMRLSEDPNLAATLAANLEARRLKSKRVWVLVRARPVEGISCIAIDRNKVVVSNTNGAPTSFFFDQAFDATATQEQVCGYVSEQVLPHALNGEHICCLAAVLQTAVSVSSL
eukprot:g9350.t1